MNDNRTILYNALKNEGYTDIGNNQEEFNKLLENPDNLRLAYDAMRNSGYTDIGESFEDFNALINPAREAVGYTAKPTRDYSQPTEAQKEFESRGGFEPIGQGKVKLGETETPVFVGAEGEWRVPSPVMLDKEEEIFRHGNPSESEKNEFVRKAKAQLKKETTQGIDSLDETISDKLLAKRREINSNYKAIPVTGVAGGMLGMSQADIVAQSDKEMTTLQAAYNLVQDSKKQVERYNRQDDGFGINTLRSAGEAAIDPSTWDFGLTDMKDSSALLNVVNKEEKGEKLTDAEQLLLDASVNNALIQAYYKAQSMGELAGSGAVNMIPFMAQILLNPLSGVGRKASSAAAKGVAKYINKKIVSKGLLANAVKKVAPRASALVVGLSADMAAGVGMAVTTNAMRTAADANERQLRGEKPGEAWKDAVLNQGIEFASENTGRFFNPLFSGIGKVVGAAAAKVAPKSVVNLAKDISKKGYSRQMKDFFKNTQWDGFLEEYAEEIAGGLMNAAYVGDMSVDKVFSKDNLLETAAGLSVASVLFPTMGTINYGVQKVKQRKRVAAAEAEAERVFGKRWPAFYEAINSAETDDELRTNIAEVYHRENRQDVTKDELQALYDYVAPLFAYRAIRDMSPSSVADMLADDVYSTAYAQDISPKLANESYKAWENAGKKVSELLNLQDQSVEDWLGGRTVEEAANGDKAVLDALTAYETAKADFEGRRDRYQQDKQRAYSESDKAIDKMANNGIVYSTQLGGQTVNITGGDVVLNENGTVGYESSSDAFYVTMPDGTVRVMASENIPGMVLAENAEELKANERAKIDERWRVEFDAAEMAEQTATPSDQVSDQVAQPVTPTANSFTLEENGTVNSVEVLDESGDVARVSINGQEVEMSHEWLAEARAAAGVEVQPISSEAVTEEQPVEVAEQETVQAATPATALERVPKDENDEPIYEQVDSDTAWDAIVEQTEGDVEMAQAVADGMVADKEVALKKLEKEKAKGAVTIAEKIAAEKERKAKIEAAKQELAKWQEIAGVAASRKAAPDINDASKTETVATEETKPTESVEAPAVEEVQATNEMQPVEEHPTVTAAEEGRDTVGGSPVALAYLLEGGKGSILNAGYFLHGVAAAFPAITNEIEALRNAMSGEVLGMGPMDFATQRAEEIAAISELIEGTYGEEGLNVFSELLNNADGFYPRGGQEVAARIEALQPIEEQGGEEAMPLVDNQGNPIDTNGKLVIEEVSSIDEITDEDFEAPTRNVQLPAIPENIANAIGTEGRSVIIKKNVFLKNGNTHVELEPADSRAILKSALYNPNLVGSTQPIKRPDYKVAIRTGEKNAVVVLDVFRDKEHVEIVGWRLVNEKGLAKMQRQAEREGGQFLILSPNDGAAAALSALPLGLSSTAKDTPQVSNEQENEQKSGEKVNTGVNEGVPENAETVPTEAENRTEPTKKVEESSKSVLNDGLQLIEAPTEVTEFDTADEFVAGLLGGIKITPESFRKETGLGIDEQRKLVGIIAGEDKGGVSVERASEIIAENYAHELAAKLNTPVEVRESADGLSGKKSKAKGWYDVKSGKIVVVVSNHSSVADIQATVLHEVVAHKGLRKLFGERFDTFLDNVYNNVDANIRAEIDALAEKYGNTREATEEYLASLAEDTRFEKVDATLWGRIKQWFLNMLAEAGIKLDFELSDNELRYILWRSYQNLANPGRYNIVKRIEDVAVRARLGIGEYAPASEEIVQVAEEDTAEYTSEEQQIIADAKANGSYMKAPNGEPTKLNEKQWAQVRTANFKKWFGDWEKATRIEKLKMSKPVEITGQEIKASEDIKEYKQNALEYGKSLRGEYTNADTGSSVQVNAQSIKEVLHHDYKEVEHLQSVAAIPALIEQGVYIDTVANELKDANSKVKEYQYYVCGLKIGGVDYTVKFVIAVDNNGNRYYDHKLTEIEKSKLLDELDRITSPSSQEENALSAIKDKRLLSILQTNSSKIVDENGEPMVVYHRTPKEFTSFDKEKIGSSTDWGAFGKGFYLSPADFGSIYGENLMSLFVNVKNPLVLNDANAFDVKQPFFSKDYSWRREQSENFTEWVKDTGYDGVWYIEGTGRDEIVAFEPNQMKSASDNTGDFSENENDIRFRERDDVASEEGKETIDDIPTRPMTLMERVKASLLEASAKNKENLKLRRDALRNLGQDLANVLKLMRAQRTYDKSTVETLMTMAKMYFKDAQLLDKLTAYEVTRIMGVLKRSVGKQNIESEAMKLMDILLDAHNKALAEVLEKTEKVKAKKVNAAGVEVMGRLDKYGQELVETYREAKDLSSELLDERIAEGSNNLAEADENVRAALGLTEADDVDAIVKDFDSTDKVKSDAVDVYMRERARYEGFVLAKEYRDGVLECKAGIAELKRDIENAKSEYKQGRMNGKALSEFTKVAQEGILELKAEMVEGYHSVIGALAHDVRESSLRAKAFVQAQIDRAQEIQHDANSDMQGRNADVQGTHPDKWNNSAVRAVMSAMPTFQTMLKKFGEQAVDGKGYLYNRFMPQVTMAADNEFRGRVAAREAIDAKLKDIYGDKKMDIGRFMDLSRKDGVSVMYIEGKDMKEFKLTKGQMLYIYMVDKMTDGEMKLRKMGITEDAVAEIAKNLDEQMIQFADWMQGEFLSDLRAKYNAVHERMFGAPMAAIENYFPLKIKKEARGEKGDVSQQNSEDKPSTVTGSIIKRTKNTTALDLSADAMSVLLEHIDNMEHWAAFAEFNRDLNTLLNYRRFQNQVKNMTTLRYGSGDVLWRNFKDVAAVAAGEYRPTKSEFDKALLNIAKGVTVAKINFRFYTAAKQILSAPAFWTGAAPQYFAKCYTNPKGSWEWAIDNLPGFKERWESRAMGNEKLLEDESDWKVWRNKFVAGATRWGMSANAAVDALTVAMGARAVYLDKYNELKKAGYSEQKADEKARQTAAEAYNESQQSSESAYLSPLQKSGTVVSAIFTTFKNSNFGYTRKTAQAIANIVRKTKGDKEKTIAFMAKQMARDGLTPAQAKAYATKLYNRSLWKDYADAALFGFGLQLLWELGGAAIYLIGGDDDEKKDAMMQEAAVRATMGTLQGLPLGETAANAVMAVMAGDAEKFRLPELVAVGDIRNVAQAMDTDAVRGATEVVNMLTSIGIGVTPQVLTDILVACNELGKSPEEFGTFLLRFMNAPQSQLEALTIDKAMEEFAKNSAEVGKEYVEYRMDKNVPYFQWLYSDEGEQKAIERYVKRFDKLLDERLDFVVEDATAYDLFYDGAQPGTKKVLSEKRQDYLAGDEAAEFVKRDTKAIVEETLYGKREINTAYFEMSTAEDEDMEFLIKKARKNLEGKADATVAQKSLLKSINSYNNAINKLKRAMQTDPTNKVKYMERIRAIRTELVDLINNSNE